MGSLQKSKQPLPVQSFHKQLMKADHHWRLGLGHDQGKCSTLSDPHRNPSVEYCTMVCSSIPTGRCNMSLGSTAKELAKCMVNYYMIS